jgi:hypothetical protein
MFTVFSQVLEIELGPSQWVVVWRSHNIQGYVEGCHSQSKLGILQLVICEA